MTVTAQAPGACTRISQEAATRGLAVAQVPRRFVREEWGGTETVILETSVRLRERGHETSIVCPNALASSNEEEMRGVSIRRYPYFYPYLGLGSEARRQLDKKGGSMFSFSLMRALRRMPSLDLVHLHTMKRVGGIVRHVCRRRRIPYVVSLHGGLFDVPAQEAASFTAPTRGTLEWGKLLGWWVGSRRVLDDAAAVICVGKEEAERVRARYPDQRVVRLPNGVDQTRFESGDGGRFRRERGIPAGSRVLLAVGRIDPQKNQRFAVRLLREVLEQDPATRLVLIGPVTDAAYERRVRAEVRELGVDDRVDLVAGVDPFGQEIVDAYHAADAFLLPSIHEPFGIVILEAWSAGVPVIASRVGGVPSFVDDGVDGLLCPPNDIGAFLGAWRRLSDEVALRDSMVSAGRAKVAREYDWRTVTGQLVDLYEEVVRANPLRQ